MADVDVLRLDPVFHPEVPNVNLPQLRSRGRASISFQLDRAFGVLLERIFIDLVPLSL